jgi:exosortase N
MVADWPGSPAAHLHPTPPLPFRLMSGTASHTAPLSTRLDFRSVLRRWWPTGLLVLGILVAGQVFLQGYLRPELNVWLALLSLPFVLYVRNPVRWPWRFAVLAVLLMVLFTVLKIKVTFHLALCFALLFLVESAAGRLNSIPMVLLLVLSPVPHYFASVMGFSLRLWLSEVAGRVFNLIGMEVEVQGNIFVQNGVEFAVDPACTGIYLFVTGLVVYVILLSYQEKRQKKSLPLWMQCGWLLIGMVGVLMANLFRIVLLVLLRSEPDTFSHDAVGMACLLFYLVLPMALLLRWSIRRWGRAHPIPDGSHDGRARWMPPGRVRMVIAGAMVAGLFVSGSLGQKTLNLEQHIKLQEVDIEGYESCITEDGILALDNEGVLVYLKPPIPFYGASHYPEICWRAGGFLVRAPAQIQIGGQEIMVARLENDESRFYTAWWYDNGESQTISPFRWRMGQLRGESGYFLVNVTVENEADLACEVLEWQGKRVVENF